MRRHRKQPRTGRVKRGKRRLTIRRNSMPFSCENGSTGACVSLMIPNLIRGRRQSRGMHAVTKSGASYADRQWNSLRVFRRVVAFIIIAHTYTRLKIAVQALDNWKFASEQRSKKASSSGKGGTSVPYPTFADRWEHDIYSEIALLAVRLLSEAGAYEIAWIVASYSVAVVRQWIDTWNKAYDRKYKFSPYIARYQLATLLAWKAFCADRLEQDRHARARLLAGKERFIGIDKDAFADIKCLKALSERLNNEPSMGNDNAIERAQALLNTAASELDGDLVDALRQMPRHPLALWVQAQRAHHHLEYGRAVEELQRLLEVLAPYDPNRSIANWHIVEKIRPATRRSDPEKSGDKTETAAIKKDRKRLHAYEFVGGRLQFAQIVNPYTVNAQLATVFGDMGRYDISVQHLMLALTLSSYWDIDNNQLLLRLTQHLDRLERLRDAQAVVTSLRASGYILDANSPSVVHSLQTEMWECVVLTRQKRYAESLAAGKRLQERLNVILQNVDRLGERYQARIEALLKSDKHNVEDIFTYICNMKLLSDDTTEQRLDADATKEGGTSPSQSTDQASSVSLPDGVTTQSPDAEATKDESKPPSSAADQASKESRRTNEDLLNNHLRWYQRMNALLDRLQNDTQQKPLTLPEIDLPEPAPTLKHNEGSFFPLEHKRVRKLFPRLDINRNIALTFLDFLAGEALALRQLQAQLLNNRAYNAIELRLQGQRTKGDNHVGDSMTEPLRQVSGAIDILKDLHNRLPDHQMHLPHLHRELAYYYDTQGWLYYRLARVDDRHKKLQHLATAPQHFNDALTHDQQSAVIYYHAARVNLTLLEQAWEQNVRLSNNETQGKDGAAIQSPDDYLVIVHHYWTQAQAHDHNGRFKAALAWIGVRLVEYRELWKAHQRSN